MANDHLPSSPRLAATADLGDLVLTLLPEFNLPNDPKARHRIDAHRLCSGGKFFVPFRDYC